MWMTAPIKVITSERQILNALYIFIKIILLPTLICMMTSKFVSKPRHARWTTTAPDTHTYVSITSYIPQHFGLISAANMDRLWYQHGPLLANPANFLHPDLIVTLRRMYQRSSKARHSDQSASIHRNPKWSRNQTAARIHRPYPMYQLITYDIAFSGFSIIWLIGGETCRKVPCCLLSGIGFMRRALQSYTYFQKFDVIYSNVYVQATLREVIYLAVFT